MSPAEFRAFVLHQLCSRKWQSSAMLPVLACAADLRLSDKQRLDLVSKAIK